MPITACCYCSSSRLLTLFRLSCIFLLLLLLLLLI
jgi:hypothetical protein